MPKVSVGENMLNFDSQIGFLFFFGFLCAVIREYLRVCSLPLGEEGYFF